MFEFIKKHWILALIIFIIIVLLLVMMFSKKKAKIDGPSPVNIIQKLANTESLYKPETFPLGLYMKGDNSKAFQKELIRRGSTIKDDGWFGPNTESESLKLTGLRFVTADDLKRLQGEDLARTATFENSAIPDINTALGLERYVDALYNNLYVVRSPLGRDASTANGIYSNLNSMAQQNFIKVYAKYKEKYGRDLATDIKTANFSLGTNVDEYLIKKSITLGLTPLT